MRDSINTILGFIVASIQANRIEWSIIVSGIIFASGVIFSSGVSYSNMGTIQHVQDRHGVQIQVLQSQLQPINIQLAKQSQLLEDIKAELKTNNQQ